MQPHLRGISVYNSYLWDRPPSKINLHVLPMTTVYFRSVYFLIFQQREVVCWAHQEGLMRNYCPGQLCHFVQDFRKNLITASVEWKLKLCFQLGKAALCDFAWPFSLCCINTLLFAWRYMGIGLSAQGVNMNRLPGESLLIIICACPVCQ